MNGKIPKEYLQYLGKETKPQDFSDFWDDVVRQVKKETLCYRLELQKEYCFKDKDIYKIVLEALDKTAILGWYICAQKKQKHCLLTTHGYRSKKKPPYEYFYWVDSGVDVLVFDMRLQGGETGCRTSLEGPLTEIIAANILDLKSSYLLLMYQDMLLASRLPKQLGYDGYFLEGTSQAGGLCMAVACLMQTTMGVMVNVPSNSDLDERVKESRGSFKAFQYLCNKNDEIYDKVMHHLSYFDTKNMAERLKAPVLASVGGIDTVCPPLSFFATYNRISGPKEIIYYPFSGHEGGEFHTCKELIFLNKQLRKVGDGDGSFKKI